MPTESNSMQCSPRHRRLSDTLPALSGVELSFSEEDIDKRVDLIASAKNYTNSPYVISEGEMREIYRSHFLS